MTRTKANVKSYARMMAKVPSSERSFQHFDRGGAVPSTDATIQAEVFTRPPLSAKPGVFTRGLVPLAVYPLDRDLPFGSVDLWFDKQQPMQGLGGVGLSNMTEGFIALTGNAATEWVAAIQEGINHLKLVISNNTDQTLSDILARPDVQEALNEAGQAGAQAVINQLQETWTENSGDPNSPYLASLISDAQDNGNTFAARMTTALSTADRDQVNRILLRDRIRASAAQSVAEVRSHTEAVSNTYSLAGGTQVQWVSHIDEKTCSACVALNGTIVSIGASFNPNLGNLKVSPYFNLVGPPRHPNCRCRLSLVKAS